MQAASNDGRAMDRNVTVHTPESIAFQYDLAGLGSRFLAVFIDTLVQIVLLLLLAWGIFALAKSAPLGAESRALSHSAAYHFGESMGVAVLIFVLFMIFYGYFILFETFWNGQTPGKKLLGIRVVRDGGFPLDFGSSAVRNLVRVGEQVVGFYFISAVSTLLSGENKRIGDFAAGTIVVRESPVAPLRSWQEALTASDAARSSAYLTDDECTTVAAFLARRASMAPANRQTIAAQLAAQLRPRAPANLQSLPDEELLESL